MDFVVGKTYTCTSTCGAFATYMCDDGDRDIYCDDVSFITDDGREVMYMKGIITPVLDTPMVCERIEGNIAFLRGNVVNQLLPDGSVGLICEKIVIAMKVLTGVEISDNTVNRLYDIIIPWHIKSPNSGDKCDVTPANVIGFIAKFIEDNSCVYQGSHNGYSSNKSNVEFMSVELLGNVYGMAYAKLALMGKCKDVKCKVEKGVMNWTVGGKDVVAFLKEYVGDITVRIPILCVNTNVSTSAASIDRVASMMSGD